MFNLIHLFRRVRIRIGNPSDDPGDIIIFYNDIHTFPKINIKKIGNIRDPIIHQSLAVCGEDALVSEYRSIDRGSDLLCPDFFRGSPEKCFRGIGQLYPAVVQLVRVTDDPGVEQSPCIGYTGQAVIAVLDRKSTRLNSSHT